MRFGRLGSVLANRALDLGPHRNNKGVNIQSGKSDADISNPPRQEPNHFTYTSPFLGQVLGVAPVDAVALLRPIVRIIVAYLVLRPYLSTGDLLYSCLSLNFVQLKKAQSTPIVKL